MWLPLAIVVFLFQAKVPILAKEPVDVLGWEMEVAERISMLPNPYQFYVAPAPETLLKSQDPWIATRTAPPGERRYFEMEDSAEMMGIVVQPRVTAGLQVEFVGPAEETKRSRVFTNLDRDPFHPSYVLTTVGVRLRF